MYISIDLGGTNTRVAASEDLSEIKQIKKFKTQKSLEEQRKEITKAVAQVSEGENITAVCIGVPGVVNSKSNTFGNIVNFIHLNSLPFAELFNEGFDGGKFIAANDAALAGLGEAIQGAGTEFETIAYLTLSTGVGGIRIANKTLDLTQKFTEPGHHIIDMGGPVDTKLEMYGTLEAFVSGQGFKRNYGLNPHECDDKEIWEDYGQKLATGLINICAFWAPDGVILGGGLSNKFELFIDSLEKNFKKQSFFELPVIKRASLGDNSGLYGGFALLKQYSL